MLKMLVDTCVLLDTARDPKQAATLGALEQLVRQKIVVLLVPRIVIEEFQRNRSRVLSEAIKSLSSQFRLVKDAVRVAGGNTRRTQRLLSQLDDVNQRLPIIGGGAKSTLDRVEKLLTDAEVIEPSDGAKVRAAQRAIDRKAPFHRDKNSMADALLIEIYADLIGGKVERGTRYAFITHNKFDFSVPNGNHKLPHPDIAPLFATPKSRYYVSLPEALRRAAPELISDIMFEYSYSEEPRGLSEILNASDLLFHQVWYNRHWNLRVGIERGDVKLVDKETYPRSDKPGEETCQRDVWKMALGAAKRVEKKYGKKNLGPWGDFDWGMINGKLSALRWVLGDEWDMLDT